MRYDASRVALYQPQLKPVYVGSDMVSAFEAANLGFSPINAWWLSNAAHLAYYEPDKLEAELPSAGLKLVEFFTQKSTQAFLAASDSHAILAFRGTQSDNLADWITDADIRLAPFEDGATVHHGFLAALDDVWNDVDEGLQAVAAQGLPIWYTGHSLGAALATLAAARRKPTALFTFGSPRVGNAAFVRLLDGLSVQRFVNCTDAAVTVPDRLLGYRHVGDLVFITSTGAVHLNPSSLQVSMAKMIGRVSYFASWPWFRPGVVAARPFADHAIVNYTAALYEAASGQP